jgi:ZIP family zinc transporter/zinc and cadmium transporter
MSIVLSLGVAAALANVAGGFAVLRAKPALRTLYAFIAFGAGFLLSVTVVEMLPESLRIIPMQGALLVLIGFCGVHLLEHTITQHFHFGEETHSDEFLHKHTGYSVVVGLSAHAFFDGVAIASGFLLSGRIGWLIFVAILLHKLPEGFTVASVMLAAGRSRRIALGAATALAVATLAGVVLLHSVPQLMRYGLPLAAGVALYVAATDLLPEVNRQRGLIYRFMFFAGVGLFLMLDMFGA